METEPNLTQAWLAKAEESPEASKLLLAQQYFEDATSRAYYAMFAAAKAALTSIQVETRGHTGLMSQFGQHFVKTGLIDAKFAKMFSTAFEARQNSDYSILSRFLPQEAQSVVSNAEEFIAIIQKLLSESHEPE